MGSGFKIPITIKRNNNNSRKNVLSFLHHNKIKKLKKLTKHVNDFKSTYFKNSINNYYDLLKNADEKDVHIIFLDTRTFRDKLMPTDDRGAPGKERYIPNLDRSLTMLGEDQWDWLRKKLAEPSDYKIIVTSIQFLPIGHGWESWNNLPYERDRLINMIDNSGLDNIAILSGDRHRGGLYQLKTSTGKTISEITSSSLNAAFPNSEEAGPLRIGGTFVDENYGVLYFHSDDNALTLALKNIKGDIVRSLSVQN